MTDVTAEKSQIITTIDSTGMARSAGYLTVYNYVADTGEYSGETTEYLMEGVGIPANSTIVSPPDISGGSVAVFSDGAWVTEEDHRGETVYSTSDGAAVEIDAIGDYPIDTTQLQPTTAYDKWDGEKWVTDATAEKAADVSSAVAQKSFLISTANSISQAWQTQLQLGIITDDDKATLTLWMKYVQSVQAVDTSLAPDIAWPDKPQ